MKQLEDDFTTPEQSKRLLELGVPADSANMYRWSFDTRPYVREMETLEHDWFERNMSTKPCWSCGRLMEIFSKCYTGAKCYYSPRNLCKTEFWIERFERLSKIGFIEFSNLKD